MKLPISQLSEGENLLSYSSTKDGWVKDLVQHFSRVGYEMPRGLEMELSLTKLEPDFFLRGKLVFDCQQPCDRCAEAFTRSSQHPFAVGLAKVDARRDPKVSEESEELDINFFEGNELDLAPIIEEQFFLSQPFQAVCKPDCKGVCQQCGRNLNTESCTCSKDTSISPFGVLKEFKAK